MCICLRKCSVLRLILVRFQAYYQRLLDLWFFIQYLYIYIYILSLYVLCKRLASLFYPHPANYIVILLVVYMFLNCNQIQLIKTWSVCRKKRKTQKLCFTENTLRSSLLCVSNKFRILLYLYKTAPKNISPYSFISLFYSNCPINDAGSW